jgi:excinuclease UvrABC ATPase subunit
MQRGREYLQTHTCLANCTDELPLASPRRARVPQRRLSNPGFDEPTTGLHFEDIKVFLDIIFELSEKGNSIIIIEHNIDVLKVSDYIIELGPNGGKNGGKITFQGKLNEIFSDKKSITGQFIKKELNL